MKNKNGNHTFRIVSSFSSICLAVLILCQPQPVKAQPAPNTIYAELLGNGILYSLNYERLVIPRVATRAGFMYLTVDGVTSDPSDPTVSVSMTLIPVSVSYLIGRLTASSRLEVGAGFNWAFVSADVDGVAGVTGSGLGTFTGILGYRYHPVDGGINFRAAFTPHMGKDLEYNINTGEYEESWIVIPFVGLSLGYSF